MTMPSLEETIESIAYCGLMCGGCPIRWATQITDPEKQKRMRIEISRKMRSEYGMNLPADGVTDCDGCKSPTGRLFSGCRGCGIRECATERGLASCAVCPDYACGQLMKFLEKEPSAKTRLEWLRAMAI
jgi:hypothetical protein